MARRRQRLNRKANRDVSPIANLRLVRVPVVYYVRRAPVSSFVHSDRRVFHPARAFRPVVGARGKVSRVQARVGRGLGALSYHFNAPSRVMACVRRKDRREVLFALGRTGRGARSPKRRNVLSNVRC